MLSGTSFALRPVKIPSRALRSASTGRLTMANEAATATVFFMICRRLLSEPLSRASASRMPS